MSIHLYLHLDKSFGGKEILVMCIVKKGKAISVTGRGGP
jgi:hypothetical protein